jgi:hypothetical protein
MDKLIVRDPHGREIEIHPSARAFWEHREGHQILPGEPAADAPAEPGDPKPSKKAASRPASEDKE